MKARTILIWLTPVVVLVLLALVLILRLRGPEQIPAPAYWPTKGWHAGPPEPQGFDSVKLAEGLQAIQQEGIKPVPPEFLHKLHYTFSLIHTSPPMVVSV